MDIDRHDPFAHPPVTAIFPEYLRSKSLELDLYPCFHSTIDLRDSLAFLHVAYVKNRGRRASNWINKVSESANVQSSQSHKNMDNKICK